MCCGCRHSAPFGLDEDVDGSRTTVPEIEADTAVGELRDRGGYCAGGEIPSGGQDNGIAGPAEAAVEHELVAV